MLGPKRFRKAGLIILAVLVLALGVLVLREHVWPPEKALASTSTLTTLSGTQVFLNEENVKVNETVRIEEGDTITTGANSWALVTFEDGSTIELEPNTEISIDTLTESSISVFQSVGRTWSGVKKLATGPINDFEIDTPSAAAVVQGTLIETVVAASHTIAAAFEGTVKVTAQEITQIIMAGLQSLIEYGKAPQLPQPIPPPKNRLEVTIDGPAWALVVDHPQQRSVGVVPPGVVVTQIPRASTTGAQAEPQFTVIPIPEEEGDYTYYIVLYGKDEGGKVDVKVKGYSEGEEIFTIAEEEVVLPYEKIGEDEELEETKYVATLEVSVDTVGDAGLITGGDLGDFQLKTTRGPGQVDIKDWATVRAQEAVAPQANFSASMKDGKINFTNLSTGDITAYSWDFGDGDTSTDMSPSHVYEEGEYTVSLTVTGVEDNIQDTARITIYVFVLTSGMS